MSSRIAENDLIHIRHITNLHTRCFVQCFNFIGGHCNSAVVSATCELIINVIEGEIDREFSGKFGLNLMEF